MSEPYESKTRDTLKLTKQERRVLEWFEKVNRLPDIDASRDEDLEIKKRLIGREMLAQGPIVTHADYPDVQTPYTWITDKGLDALR